MKKRKLYFITVVSVVFLCSCATESEKNNKVSDKKESMELEKEVQTLSESEVYEQANQLYDNKKYAEALELYINIHKYKDSKDKAELCKKEIGMNEKSDYEFLDTIEKSILNRMSLSNQNADYKKMVNTELAYLEKYEKAEFYDNQLMRLAKKYIEGLSIQKDALSKEFIWEYQLLWQKGLVYRGEVLKSLYDNYNFLSEDTNFIGTYISEVEDNKKLLNAYEKIEADITSQLTENYEWSLTDENYLYGEVTNNTEYTYSTTYEYSFYDVNNTLFDSNQKTIENIKPGDRYSISVYIPEPDRVNNFKWNNYYLDVKW